MFISASDGYPMPFEEPEDWSEEFHDFITHCLQCDPTERWTVPQLLEVLFFHIFPFYRHHRLKRYCVFHKQVFLFFIQNKFKD